MCKLSFSLFYDELGIPYSVCIDSITKEDDTVTVRDRDTLEQIRVKIPELAELINKLCKMNSKDAFDAFEEIRLAQLSQTK